MAGAPLTAVCAWSRKASYNSWQKTLWCVLNWTVSSNNPWCSTGSASLLSIVALCIVCSACSVCPLTLIGSDQCSCMPCWTLGSWGQLLHVKRQRCSVLCMQYLPSAVCSCEQMAGFIVFVLNWTATVLYAVMACLLGRGCVARTNATGHSPY